jgi:hypothetical protein
MVRWSGRALAAGGALTFLINAGLTPFLPRGTPFVETAASVVFLWRQSLSAAAGVLILFGAVGLYLRQRGRAGRFGGVAFALAFLGSALLVAHEWTEVFLVRDLALRAPDALRSLEAPGRPGLYDIGAMTALGTFTAGWIALAVSTLRVTPSSRRGAWLVIAGFFAIPLLGAALPGAWGIVAGNAVLGAGWILLGADLLRADPPEASSTV